MTILWPDCKLLAADVSIVPAYRSLRGSANAYGAMQVVSSDAGIWKGTLANIDLHQRAGAQKILLWDAMAGLLAGQQNAVLLPVPVNRRRPLPADVVDADVGGDGDIPFSDGATFSDGSGYRNTWIDVTVAASAALRATSVTLTKTACGTIEPGMRFSIGERLYQIKSVASQSASSADVTINFPLREAVAAGERCNFARPVVRMKLATDSEMDILLVMRRRASATVNFVEDY